MNLLKTHPVLGTILVALVAWVALLIAVPIASDGDPVRSDWTTALWIGAALSVGLLASLATRRARARARRH